MSHNVRTFMKQRAVLERNSATGTDALNQPVVEDFDTLETVACRVYSRMKHYINDKDKQVLVESLWAKVPLGTDVTELDRIANITDRQGVVLFAGPFLIDAIQPKAAHLELALRVVD